MSFETGKTSVWAGKESWNSVRTFNNVQDVNEWKLRGMKFPNKGKACANTPH